MSGKKPVAKNGKGDRDRSDPKKYAAGYERIFGKKRKVKKDERSSIPPKKNR